MDLVGSPTELNTESTIYQTTTDPGLVKEPDLRIIKVVDRFEVILQIFASRAKSRMAQIQVCNIYICSWEWPG